MNSRSAIASQPILATPRNNWLRRWWPTLAPATLSVACAAVVAVQQNEIRQLRHSLETLSTTCSLAPAPTPATYETPSTSPSAAEQEEIVRLREQVAALSSDIAALEKFRAENQALRSRLATPAGEGFTPEENAAINAARERAQRIACVNNLKQVGLAARIWAGDNNDRFPPDIVCMSNEMNTPKILVCPADQSRIVATNFQSFTEANCSYEFFLNPPGSDDEPSRVLTRCLIHNNVGLYDGSVQTVGTNQSNWFVQREGKLYFENPNRRESP